MSNVTRVHMTRVATETGHMTVAQMDTAIEHLTAYAVASEDKGFFMVFSLTMGIVRDLREELARRAAEMATSQDLGQRYSVRTTTFSGVKHHLAFDSVTSQRLTDHAERSAAQRECDARNVDYCHSLATGYDVQELPFWQLETGESWRVIDTRRAEGYEATTALAKVTLTEANARLVAEWANRTQPVWHVGTAEALGLMREYFAGRLAATLDVLDY